MAILQQSKGQLRRICIGRARGHDGPGAGNSEVIEKRPVIEERARQAGALAKAMLFK